MSDACLTNSNNRYSTSGSEKKNRFHNNVFAHSTTATGSCRFGHPRLFNYSPKRYQMNGNVIAGEQRFELIRVDSVWLNARMFVRTLSLSLCLKKWISCKINFDEFCIITISIYRCRTKQSEAFSVSKKNIYFIILGISACVLFLNAMESVDHFVRFCRNAFAHPPSTIRR